MSYARQVVGSEWIGQQFSQPPRPIGAFDEHVRSAVFEEELATSPAWHQRSTHAVDTHDSDQPASPAAVQGRHHRALGAETKAI